MDGGHEAFDDSILVIENFGKRRETIGGAGCVGDLQFALIGFNWRKNNGFTHDIVLGVVRVEVNTADEHWSVSGRCGDDDLFGTTLQMSRSSSAK